MTDPLDGEPLDIAASDLAKSMPAARCRGCGVVTWTIRLDRGLEQTGAKHRTGCSHPVGRVDLWQDVPPAQRARVCGGRLMKTMGNEEVRRAADEVAEWKSRKG